jgi:hypothetical protein
LCFTGAGPSSVSISLAFGTLPTWQALGAWRADTITTINCATLRTFTAFKAEAVFRAEVTAVAFLHIRLGTFTVGQAKRFRRTDTVTTINRSNLGTPATRKTEAVFGANVTTGALLSSRLGTFTSRQTQGSSRAVQSVSAIVPVLCDTASTAATFFVRSTDRTAFAPC